jgi:histidyl-tRNA synthetase
LYKINVSQINIENLKIFINEIEKIEVIFSFMPILDEKNDNILNFLKTKKDKILGEKFFLDSPQIYKKVI